MPKSKFIVVSNHRHAGKHVAKGSIIELDPDVTADANIIAGLANAGRIGLASPELMKQIKEELESEKIKDQPAK